MAYYLRFLCFLCLLLAGTPYEAGTFKVKLVLDRDFPASPPKGLQCYLLSFSFFIILDIYIFFKERHAKILALCGFKNSFYLVPVNHLISSLEMLACLQATFNYFLKLDLKR